MSHILRATAYDDNPGGPCIFQLSSVGIGLTPQNPDEMENESQASVKLLAAILARGGSKGLPGKNLRELGGKPLILWTIEAALGAPSVSRVIVSTDCEDIGEVSCAGGAEVVMRPPPLATDSASSSAACEHLLKHLSKTDGYRPEYMLLLQPTSPLRTSEDIEKLLVVSRENSGSPVVAVVRVKSHPLHCLVTSATGELVPLFPDHAPCRRQELPEVFQPNGAMYLVKCSAFLANPSFVPPGVRPYIMSEERSVDIDTLEDFRRAEQLLTDARGF